MEPALTRKRELDVPWSIDPTRAGAGDKAIFKQLISSELAVGNLASNPGRCPFLPFPRGLWQRLLSALHDVNTYLTQHDSILAN